MTPKTRNAVYVALATLNVAFIALSQHGTLPAAWAHGVAVASLVCAALMREFGASDGTSPPKPPPIALGALLLLALAFALAACPPAVTADAIAVRTDELEQQSCIQRVPANICADASAEHAMTCVHQQMEAMDACRADVRAHRDADAEGGDR